MINFIHEIHCSVGHMVSSGVSFLHNDFTYDSFPVFIMSYLLGGVRTCSIFAVVGWKMQYRSSAAWAFSRAILIDSSCESSGVLSACQARFSGDLTCGLVDEAGYQCL